MKILIITPYFHPENFRINDLAVEYNNKGHKVSVLTPIPNYPDGKFYSGYSVLKRRQECWNGIDIYRSLLIPRGSGSNIMLAISWISSVFGNLITSLFILLKTKLIPKLLMPIIRFTYNNCDKVLVSSPGFIDSIAEKNIDKGKIHFFPQWAEPIFKRVENTQVKLSVVPQNSFIVMFAGNIGESQDFDSILKAAEKL